MWRLRGLVRGVANSFLALSAGLLAFVVISYVCSFDILTAPTVLPFWMWSLLGLSLCAPAFLLIGSWRSRTLVLFWLISSLLLADEVPALWAKGQTSPVSPDRPPGLVRVVTLNTLGSRADPAELLKVYDPDVLCLQEVQGRYALRRTADPLFDQNSPLIWHYGNGTTFTLPVEGNLPVPGKRLQLTTLTLPNGAALDVLNVHLVSAETRIDFWRKECWQAHKQRRLTRRQEVGDILRLLDSRRFPHRPAIVLGDFNATVQSGALRDLSPRLNNISAASGNTFHSLFPTIRIDHIYATPGIEIVNLSNLKVDNSDHRLLIADLKLPAN